jgi:hypothetical protein
MMSAGSNPRRKVAAAVLLASASLAALLVGMPRAAAEECAGQATLPADLATPSQVFGTLRTRTNAELLAISFLRKPVARTCTWIYEVKVLTASGSVVELDFDAQELDLVGARGPENDRDAAALVKQFGGDGSTLTTSASKNGPRGSDTSSSHKGSSGNGDDGGGDDHDGNDGGEGGEGGNSGSGGGDNSSSGGGDNGGEDGGDGGGDGGDGGEGGDGGGEGGGDD